MQDQSITTEEWRPVVGHEGIYEVSDQGRVRSVSRIVATTRGPRRRAGRMKRQHLSPGGYWRTSIVDSTVCVHALVAAAFLGARPAGHQVCHNNGVSADNRVENLRYDTPAGNAADTARHGRLKGTKNGQAKLTEEHVRRARQMRAAGKTLAAIGDIFGVHESTIHDACSGRGWGWL